MTFTPPNYPVTHDGVKQFLHNIGDCILSERGICGAYAIRTDDRGGCFVQAECNTTDGLYTIRVDLTPVVSE